MVKKKRPSDPSENGDDSTESCEENVKSTCPHMTKAVDLTKLRKIVRADRFEKECPECKKLDKNEVPVTDPDFEEDNSLWMCLRCGTQLCSQSRNQHALNHFRTPHSDCHTLTVNTSTWIVYCYTCENEVTATSSKKLHECIEYLKKQASGLSPRPSPPIELPYDNTILKTELLVNKGKDKAMTMNYPRVRGLSNLGNTCFFNSVMQCLVQTPYLLNVLKEMSSPGEKFTLPGGKLKLKGGDGEEAKEVDLPPIAGQLAEWGTLTRTLAETLETLQTGDGGVHNPRPLLSALINKLPQFGGGDQHDAHELLRHLLEAVRSEDLRRYQSVILHHLGMNSKVDPTKVDGEVKQKVKFYGQQASDTMLRPEQVFRGFLVSTLECQDCYHQSDRAEYFLDLSLPVAAGRPQPRALVRRKVPNEDNTFNSQEENKSKHQIKKEKMAAKKAARKNKGNSISKDESSSQAVAGKEEGKTSSSQSDADVEDNLEDSSAGKKERPPAPPLAHTAANFAAYHMESGYSSDKVLSLDSVRAASPQQKAVDQPAIPLDYKPLSNPDSGVASPEATKHNSTETVDNDEFPINKEMGSHSSLSSEMNLDLASPQHKTSPVKTEFERPVSRISFAADYGAAPYANEVVSRGISAQGGRNLLEHSGESSYESLSEAARAQEAAALSNHADVVSKLGELGLGDEPRRPSPANPPPTPPTPPTPPRAADKPPRERHSPLASRYVCDEDECSVQSCLSQFTALELLTGNNKVGCENCTRRINGENGKNVYTNATKRFLVSSPPAILILHLKRFQLGLRCMFRKMTKHVDFPTVLDLAPFCAMDKLQKLPNVSRGQRSLLYSLYGVVEHSGGMHGGHYVAYVKVRAGVGPSDPRWWFLPRSANAPPAVPAPPPDRPSDSDLSGYESDEGSAAAPPGRWYYVSDSMVSEVKEEKVLQAQAYLLFYERIL